MSKIGSKLVPSKLAVTPALGLLAIAGIAATGLAGASHLRGHAAAEAGHPAPQRANVRATFANLPLGFEANQGQTDPQVKYIARGSGYTVFLTNSDAVFAMTHASGSEKKMGTPNKAAGAPLLAGAARRGKSAEKLTAAAIYMKPVGANPHPQIASGRELPGVINYYIGPDRSQWREGVKQYATVDYRNVYPGVDMMFHGQQRQLEFDFVVAPNANPAPIALGFTGAKNLALDPTGNLVLASSAGDVVLHKPVAYQEKNGQRQPVDVAFDLKNNSEAAFTLGVYDHSRELVIDPSLSYATYLGGTGDDEALAIAVDASGNTYVTGFTSSASFHGKPAGPNENVFVTKVDASASSLTYTDVFEATGTGTNCSAGGTGDCSGNAIAVDGSGNAYVVGLATAGFPTLLAYQTTYGGGTSDAFALKVNSSGTLVYSTYLGGSGIDYANAIAVDGSGNAYITGSTSSSDFPTKNPKQGSLGGAQNDAFVTKLSGSGSTLSYSTYLGGGNNTLGTGIALDGSNNAYVTGITASTDFPLTTGVLQSTYGGGDDGFVTEVKADGSDWVYSTYLGGTLNDEPLGIAVDSAGNVYVTGSTNSANFPVVAATQAALGGASATNVFLSKVNVGGTALLFSTYYGGSQTDSATAVAVDAFGDAYLTGATSSANYPVSNSFQNSLSGTADAFVTEFSNSGFVVYSSYLGGTGVENQTASTGPFGAIAVDSSSNAYVAGVTNSTSLFPVTSGVLQSNYAGGLTDGFVAKVAAAPGDFSVLAAPDIASAASGSTTGAVTVTVASVNAAYSQAVTLGCSNLPPHAACNFTTGSITPGTAGGTSTLTIATNAAASSASVRSSVTRTLVAMFLPIGAIALLGAGFGGRRKKLFGMMFLGIAILSLLLLPACGGGSSSGGGGGNNTPKGKYTINVTGSGGGAQHSFPLTLNVL